MSEDRPVRKGKGFARKVALSLTAAAPVGGWLALGGNPLPTKIAAASAPAFDEAEATRALKAHMIDVILSYHYRDGAGHRLSQVELDYGRSLGRDLNNDYEVLDEMHSSNGFYGVLFRDKHTNQTSLAIAGMDFSYSAERRNADLDDAFVLTTGNSWNSQVHDAIEFAHRAQRVSMEKTGHGIDAVSGHSLGGSLTQTLAMGNVIPEAKYFIYEGPGVVANTVSSASRIFGIPASTMMRNLRDNSSSFTITPNAVNNMGRQPGQAMTVNNDPQSLNPLNRHFYDDSFVRDTAQAASLTRRTDDQASYTAAIAITVLIGLAGLPWRREIWRGVTRRKEPEPGEQPDSPRR